MEVRFVITLLAILQSARCYKKCATESYDVKNGMIKWDSTNGSVVISNPPCLDDKGRYVTRACRNGAWEPNIAPHCHTVANITQCPQGFLELGNNCIQISEPKTFDQLCPFPGIRYYNYDYINSSSEFWLPIKKSNTTYIYTSIDRRYGREYKMHIDNITGDCFLIKSGDPSMSNCEILNRHLCSYRKPNYNKLNYRSINSSKPVRLDLKFDQNREKVLLTVYSPENLITKLDEDDEYAVYCFTDAAINEMKSRVKKKEVYNSLKHNSSDNIQHMIVYEIPIKQDHAGQYWCEAFNTSESSIKSNMIIAYKKRKGNEFALRVILLNACGNSTQIAYADCSRITTDIIYGFLERVGFKTIFHGLSVVVRLMKIYGKVNEFDIDVLLHLSTPRQTNVVGEYYKLQRFFEDLEKYSISVVSFRSSEVCITETVDNLTFKVTNLWNKATPKQFCIDNNSMPVVRNCMGDFLEGAYWSDDYNKCADDQYDSVSNITLQLYTIANSDEFVVNLTCVIKNLTMEPENLTALDIYLVASTMYNVSTKLEEESDVDNLVETIHNVLESDGDTLKRAQLVLNATDTILDSIDTFLQEDLILTNITNEPYIIRKDKFLVHITKPFLSNVSGLAIYSNDDSNFDDDEIINIHLNETFDNITMDNLDLSVYIPNSLLQTFLENAVDKNNLTIITTVHFNDKLFNSDTDDNETIFGHVISVTIPNYGIFLQEPIPLLFKNKDDEQENHCAFWEYGMNSPNKIGHWSGSGGNTMDVHKSNYSKCSFTHLTHFALLIMSQKMFVDEVANVTDITEIIGTFNRHDDALTVITVMGCTLSLVGILGIFLTAAFIKRWRQKAGSKILLQLSVTISLEIIVIQIAGADFTPNKTLSCQIVGICLHYVVLSKFSWMFVSAILQYIRFVKVFSVTPPRLVLKAMIFGWCVPLIPVIALVCVSPTSYGAGAQTFCYPTGWGLYLGLFTPVVFIVVANLIVFTLVMKNVMQDRIERRGKSKDSQKLQFYLAILLFFMLGIPWVFGILAEMVKHRLFQLIFMYLFCLTATLQGCVIFVFYVILDRETRNLWMAMF